MMIKERLVSTLASSQIKNPDQSKKALEKMMDEKLYFYDSQNAYIINWIDYSNIAKMMTTENDEGKNIIY